MVIILPSQAAFCLCMGPTGQWSCACTGTPTRMFIISTRRLASTIGRCRLSCSVPQAAMHSEWWRCSRKGWCYMVWTSCKRKHSHTTGSIPCLCDMRHSRPQRTEKGIRKCQTSSFFQFHHWGDEIEQSAAIKSVYSSVAGQRSPSLPLYHGVWTVWSPFEQFHTHTHASSFKTPR